MRNAGLETDLRDALLDAYQRAGEEISYWGFRYRRSILDKGALSTVKRMLRPRRPEQRKGLDAALDANRPDLTMEAVVLRSKFRPLFSAEEIRVAADRLRKYRKEGNRRMRSRERLYPEELEPGKKYIEGSRKQIRINSYERDRRARLACLKHFGYRCSVCDLLFEQRYGKLGKEFIHVHHLKPFELTNGAYRLDPIRDLRPVCPNCHAMLHRPKRVLSIGGLRAAIGAARRRG
jgi:5-methylcytosine-specific restriction enzyme A